QTARINRVDDHRGAVRGVGQAAKAHLRQRHALGKQDYCLPAGHVVKAIDHVTKSAQRTAHEHVASKLIDGLFNRVEFRHVRWRESGSEGRLRNTAERELDWVDG